MSPSIEKIQQIIEQNQSKKELIHFVLQGGAGSGKTESLKEIIAFISEKYPALKVACITHTNVAANEIKSRVKNDKYKISTIHSFLNEQIKNYKKNLHEILPVIFHIDDSEIVGHDGYKKRYEKLANKKFQIQKESSPKVIVKREYDKSPGIYNGELLTAIRELNSIIDSKIIAIDYRQVQYNETKFDSFEEASFSHNSLIKLSNVIGQQYPLFTKILSDKFDFIFIDEYQDTNPDIIDLFINKFPENQKTTIGLFGDSMQGIYDDGIGDVSQYVQNCKLELIPKEDNFRCSKQIVDFINQLRDDDINQSVSLKKDETIESRQGRVKFFLKILIKPTSRDSDGKNLYLQKLNDTIATVKTTLDIPNLKILLLTNKSISKELRFEKLYDTFDDRYSDVKDEIEKDLNRLQISSITDLIMLFKTKKFNELLLKCKKNGYYIKVLKDKDSLIEYLTYLETSDLSFQQALDYCFEKKLLRQSESHSNFKKRAKEFLENYATNSLYNELESFYNEGSNTLTRVNTNHGKNLEQPEFDEFLSDLKKKKFYEALASNDLKLTQAINYYNYLNEDSHYITMHKTKGSGIENVLVVLEEYFWSKYNFKSLYEPNERTIFNSKLFYVACSRAIKNLTILRIVETEQERALVKERFKFCEFIDL